MVKHLVPKKIPRAINKLNPYARYLPVLTFRGRYIKKRPKNLPEKYTKYTLKVRIATNLSALSFLIIQENEASTDKLYQFGTIDFSKKLISGSNKKLITDSTCQLDSLTELLESLNISGAFEFSDLLHELENFKKI